MKLWIARLILTISITLFPLALSAQNTTNDWHNVVRISTGTLLFVETKDGKTIKGVLELADINGLKIQNKKGPFVLQKDVIKKVFFMEAKSKKRGKAFGAILGLVLGYVVVDKSIDITTASAPEVAFAFAYLAGGFGGAYIGGLLARGKKKGALIFESK